MGFNSVVLICNDAISEIENDPGGWWRKAWQKLCLLGRDDDGTFGYGNHGGYFQAVLNQHADCTGVIIVGGNHATVVDTTHLNDHHTEDGQDAILKDILEKRGYRVTKKKK